MERRSQALAIAFAAACAMSCAGEERSGGDVRKGSSLNRLLWSVDRRFSSVNAVWTHPVDADLVYVSTARGLVRTRDGGRTWDAAKGAGLPVGEITALLPCPAEVSFLYAGTRKSGVFASADWGDTWRPLAGADKGLISLSVADLCFWPMDLSWGSFFASHGKAAPGISFTEDGGNSWRAVASKTAHFGRVRVHDEIIIAESAATGDPDTWNLARSYDVGAHWTVTRRDISPMSASVTFFGQSEALWATADEGILRAMEKGMSWASVGPKGDYPWASVLATWGATARDEAVCIYDPTARGLLRSTDRMQTWADDNHGLHVGRFVKDGAHVAASANGAVFFACINGALYVGRTLASREAPAIVSARCDPSAIRMCLSEHRGAEETLRTQDPKQPKPPEVLAAARKLVDGAALNLRVTVDHAEGLSTIRDVRADLDLLGGARDAILFDDGKHGDGQPRDGTYGLTLPFSQRWFEYRIERDPRPTLPGRAALTVTVSDRMGNVRTCPVVVGFFLHPEPFCMWTPDHAGWWKPRLQGPVSIDVPEKKGMDPNKRGFVIASKEAKAWSVSFSEGQEHNTCGQKFAVLLVKGSASPPDLFFSLYDSLGFADDRLMDDVGQSKEVGLISGGYVAGIAPEWRKVRVPIGDLAGGTPFKRGHVCGFRLRVPDGAPPGQYQIDYVGFEPK